MHSKLTPDSSEPKRKTALAVRVRVRRTLRGCLRRKVEGSVAGGGVTTLVVGVGSEIGGESGGSQAGGAGPGSPWIASMVATASSRPPPTAQESNAPTGRALLISASRIISGVAASSASRASAATAAA